MLTWWEYVVTLADGRVEVVERVTREHVAEGVLSLYQRETSYGPKERHLGSWPLVNVQRWVRSEQ